MEQNSEAVDGGKRTKGRGTEVESVNRPVALN
jgi:hypothetical protein